MNIQDRVNDNRGFYPEGNVCVNEPVMQSPPSLNELACNCFNNAQEIDELAFMIENRLIGVLKSGKDRSLKSEPDTLEAKLLILNSLLCDTKGLLRKLYERI